MKSIIVAAPFAILVLAGCSVSTGGVGQMRDGAPVSGSINRDVDKLTFTVISARGWQCSGEAKAADFNFANSATRNVPLTCTNGATGNGVVAVNQFADQATMTFVLSNGQEGTVAFGGR